MRRMGLVPTSVIVALAMGYLACGGDKPKVETPPTPSAEPQASAAPAETAPPKVETPPAETAKAEAPPPPPRKTAKEIIEAGGTFMFSLADSADAKKLATDKCEKDSKKDAKKLEACNKAVEASAATEGIRFEKDGKGALWYTAFGKEKDKEVIHIKMAFKIAKSDGDKLTVNPEGKAQGKLANKPAPKEVTMEVPDESTVKVTDPSPAKKGVLVFKKK